MKLIIAGGRECQLSDQDIKELNKLKDQIKEVVSGGAKGIDTCGEVWAKENKIPVKRFLPDWRKYGKSAGFIRNKQMADYADALAVFPGGRGTDNMYQNAAKKGLKIYDFRKLKDFKEWIYKEGFGFDWSKLKPMQLQKLFKGSSKEIQISLAGKKIIDYLVSNYGTDSIGELEISDAYKRLSTDNSKPESIRRKLESILKSPNAEINIKSIPEPLNKKFNIQKEIIKLDTELDKQGIKGLVYFSEEDKPYDLFRLKPVNERKTLRLLKSSDDLLLNIKVFYAFKLAPVSLGRSTIGEEDQVQEDPYVFSNEKSKLSIDASNWKSRWSDINKQINEIEKKIRTLNSEILALAPRWLPIPEKVLPENKEQINIILDYLSTNKADLTHQKFNELCAKANVQPRSYGMFQNLYSYAEKYAKIDKQIKEQNNLKKELQKEKASLSSVYFKPDHYIGKRITQKSKRIGTVQPFIKEAANAFMKIMKKPVTENQKMVQMHLIEQCVNIYSEKNPDKEFDIIVFPESGVDEFGENFNKNLAAEFSYKYGCQSVELKKLNSEQIYADEGGARTYYEFKGLSQEQIEKNISRLKSIAERVKKSGQIKVAKREHTLRFFIKMFSNDILKSNDFRNKRVLVIDDNTTSGATFQQVSEVLSPGKPLTLDFYVPFVR